MQVAEDLGFDWADLYSAPFIGAGRSGLELLRDRIHLGLRLLQPYAGLELRHHPGPAIPSIRNGLWRDCHHERQPHIRTVVDAAEPSRHDTQNRVRLIV